MYYLLICQPCIHPIVNVMRRNHLSFLQKASASIGKAGLPDGQWLVCCAYTSEIDAAAALLVALVPWDINQRGDRFKGKEFKMCYWLTATAAATAAALGSVLSGSGPYLKGSKGLLDEQR
jgi:hypothetical protein